MLGAAGSAGPGPAAADAPAVSALPAAPHAEMQGFTAGGAATEAALEARFDAGLSADDDRTWMRILASAPNHVGSAHDKENAGFMLAKFREWGWSAEIETFSVLYPTPREVRLELTAPRHFVAKLREPPIAGDATSKQTSAELPPYNVYGADGDVNGELVYANHGIDADYRELERMGVSVKGRIVLVRYGGGWRGLKPKLAYEHGAIGCVIYSDPADDGYGKGDVYPRGGFRPADAVQRGSVQDILQYTGDPLTPGVGSTPGAARLSIADARTILKIPVLPISYADALPLMSALGGPVAPESWRGGLPIAYHLGPGEGSGAARVHLAIRSDWTQKPLYDVIAKLPGAVEPDRWIIRGNHHDAWVFGASDPLSGTVAMMSEAKAIGRLVKEGWRSRRTLIYASWDGEEPGLIGSTEWVEAHETELARHAALYVNSDMNGRGFLHVAGSQGLQSFASEVARDVGDPETHASVLDRAVAARRVQAYAATRSAERDSRPRANGSADGDLHRLSLGALGSGSDYTPFLQHIGISSLDLGFSGESDYGVYHSAYDSYDHFRRFVDPTFAYEAALAAVAGHLVLRAAQAELLPTRASDFAHAVADYVAELHRLEDRERAETQALGELLDAGAFPLAADAQAPLAAPQREGDVPYLEFATLDNAVIHLEASGAAFDAAYRQSLASEEAGTAARRERINGALTVLEETLTDPRGLPRRAWYRHLIYAPGTRTGYEAKTLPAIREAIEERRWDEANEYITVVADALDAYRGALDRVIAHP
jgi:N-acetylated-alpha-linked acidic dipeptidase